MIKKIKNKRAEDMGVKKIAALILLAIVIVLVIAAMVQFGFIDWIKNLPSFSQEKKDYELNCIIHFATVLDNGEIYFCNNKECNLPASGMPLSDPPDLLDPLRLVLDGKTVSIILPKLLSDDSYPIGKVKNLIVVLDDQIVNREGELFTEISRYLPSFERILNLNGARIYFGKEICRTSLVSPFQPPSNWELIGSLKTKDTKIKLLIYNPIYTIPGAEADTRLDIFGTDFNGMDQDLGLYFQTERLWAGSKWIGSRREDRIVISEAYSKRDASISNQIDNFNKNVRIPSGSLTLQEELNGAYIVQGRVYRDTSAVPGKVSNKPLTDMI